MLVLVLALACKGNRDDEPRPVLVVTPIGRPEVSGCLDEVDVPLFAQVDPAYVGEQAHFESDGEILWEGVLTAQLDFTVHWSTALGSVTGAFVSGEARGGVVFPVNVRAPEDPAISTFGLSGSGAIVEEQDLPDLMGLFPAWGGALPVDPYSGLAVVLTEGHTDLGIENTVVMRRCPTTGPCEELPTTQSDLFWVADLEPVAEGRCDDLSDRTPDRLEVEITNACGTTTRDLEVRMVHDDCDGDGVIAAADCDDQDAALVGEGDLGSDGVAVSTIEEALLGSEIVVCGGTFAGGWVIDHDVTLRSASAPVTIEAPASGPTLHITGGDVVLRDLTILGGDAGVLGGGAISAENASSLTLRDVDLDGGTGDLGGNLLGPRSGALDVLGGTWSNGSAVDGGNAYLFGGDVSFLRIEGGLASARGGGVFTEGTLDGFELELEANAADRGAGVFIDHANAVLAGASFAESHAVTAGGAIAAELDPLQTLELEPAAGSLDLVAFDVCTADEGGAIWMTGGTLDSLYLAAYEASARRGGVLRLIDTSWEDRSGVAVIAEADEDGAFAALTGGFAQLLGTDVLNSAAGRGALFLDGGASVTLQSSDITATGCGVWIEDGAFTGFNVTGSSTPADVCGPAFQSPYGGTCTQEGC
ncbi:MAG: hypothetical protein R3F61_25235 [Myxococcota bacterium]